MTFTKEQREAKKKIQDEIAARREQKIRPLINIAKKQFDLETRTKLNMIKLDHADFFSMIKNSFNGQKRYSGQYWDNEKTIDPLIEESLKSFTTFQNYLSDRLKQIDQIKPDVTHYETEIENKIYTVMHTIKEFERYTNYLSEVRIQLETLLKIKEDVLRRFYEDQRIKYGLDSYYQPNFDQDGKPDEKTKELLLRSGEWKE